LFIFEKKNCLKSNLKKLSEKKLQQITKTKKKFKKIVCKKLKKKFDG